MTHHGRAQLHVFLLAVGFVVGLVGLLSVGGWVVCSDWVPQDTIDRLSGASRDEVRLLLGDPAAGSDSLEGPGIWYYRRPARIAEFQVCFGEDGRVVEWTYDR
jgi:hypothetical protein